MAEIAKRVMAKEAFVLTNETLVITKGTIFHMLEKGTERCLIYSDKGEYLGQVYNPPYTSIPEPIRPFN